jgi:uroporphyrinogen-III decarboxylase
MTPPLHGPKDFFDFNVPYDKMAADMIHNAGGYLHIHCHGPVKNILHYFVEMGMDVIHPIEPPPLGDVTPAMAKEAFRGKACIEGNLQIGDMYDATPDEIREQVRVLVRDAFDDGTGLIICPTASPFIPQAGKCVENYIAMMDEVLK